MRRDVGRNVRHTTQPALYQRLMAGLRSAIENGTLSDFVSDFYARRDLPVPAL